MKQLQITTKNINSPIELYFRVMIGLFSLLIRVDVSDSNFSFFKFES
ncbi:hypothetical protein M132_0247 [Bacteroides fragilis str. S24L15]|nr:hypothetical protein M108_0322 [Bacteroides fragilis str. 3397 T14]EYA73056.1 hypothetical protein M132_0247 [Bacteroides fragilis str. S24L15]EYA77636.1 hypothetical protein M133_0285 [Bacteroides fragilis str. S24L26]